jgi:hypothetical protein
VDREAQQATARGAIEADPDEAPIFAEESVDPVAAIPLRLPAELSPSWTLRSCGSRVGPTSCLRVVGPELEKAGRMFNAHPRIIRAQWPERQFGFSAEIRRRELVAV